MAEEKRGIVWRSTGSWYTVRDEKGDFFACRLKGKFKIKGLKVTNPIAVGDKVLFHLEPGSDENGVIHDILARENYIIRKSVHKTAHGHLLACNIDQAILIVTLTFPRTSLGFIDRFLVSSESFRIPTVLLFNKCDLLDEEVAQIQDEYMNLYSALGYPSLSISALQGINLDAVRSIMEGKTSLISGHSGVGKSALVNTLIPHLDLATSAVSTFANKGVHTTTFAEMHEMNANTFLIDSPGIKELGLVDMSEEEVAHYFPEMRDLIGACRFHNCKHVNEPNCAVKEAVLEGQIAQSRYFSYLSILENVDNRR
ncbi:ribosome small subunit-dependent GTPase A [Marinilongibacter aquaticus]|uniref:ribosome small subunit-dependent GTPase A n=1 Tax=Marinilongibacter aquaticus TaxID=2975157 RepID=UPI0021BDA875|nr:ribosome small subunit-dependent GTPase A [Marinilongibacter aquaticus]UBM60604.1 ribosome small subunit-dependent GTPase A [Marinilongibacter aquaticus]